MPAAEIVGCGLDRWETERPLRLAGEAVIGRIGDVASKLPEEVIRETPDVPWDEVRGMRIVVDHVYHAVDYRIVADPSRRCAEARAGHGAVAVTAPRDRHRDGRSGAGSLAKPVRHLSSRTSRGSVRRHRADLRRPDQVLSRSVAAQPRPGRHVGLSGTGFRRRIMDKVPDGARESTGRGARAAKSDSLLTRVSRSSA